MKFLFDLFPVIAFFIAFKIPEDPHQGVLLATAMAIVASLIQVAVFWLKNRRFETLHLATFALILVLGGATLLLQDERFIKWKPTAVNWLFGTVLIGSQLIGKKNLVQRMLGGKIDLPGAVWNRLNLSWGLFFLSMGAANLYVAFHFETETWVNFKVFGSMGLTLLFVLVQALYLVRHTAPSGETKGHE